MSKIKLLLEVVSDLRCLAESIEAVAEMMATGSEPEVQTVEVAAEPVVTKAVTLEQVRAVLADKSRGGKTAEIRELLARYGVAKLSEIDASHFPALLLEAEAL